MNEEIILEDEIIEGYSLDGVYEEIKMFSETTTNFIQKIQNSTFRETIKQYFLTLVQ